MPPTLLVKGSLRGHPESVPVQVITGWLRRRMPEYGGKTPTQLKDRVIIAKSETGSGKSTVLPVYVFRLLRNERTPPQQEYTGRSVLCTQPRVLTAMTLASDMAAAPYYPDLVLPGTEISGREARGTVGFQTGPITNKPAKGLIYSTAGVLLAQLQAAAMEGDFSPISELYSFIIIDEAHERSLDIDRVLMLIKEYLRSGLRQGGEAAKKLPFIILASATINVERYARFFDLIETEGAAKGMPIESNYFHVVGRQHGIETRWPDVGTNDYIKSAVDAAVKIHLDFPEDPPDQRDVLIFMPGGGESKKVATALEKLRDDKKLDAGGPVAVLVIDREVVNTKGAAFVLVKAPIDTIWGTLERNELYSKERLDEMRTAGLYARRIVISTVVAETGLTIETLKYVIDAGWNRAAEMYQPYGIGGLITRPAAQSRIKQRKGRAGRQFPGVFYPLYTENVYNALPVQQMPDIVTGGIGSLLLTMILGQRFSSRGRDEFRLENIDMLDPPPTDGLLAALDQAIGLGFVSQHSEIREIAKTSIVDGEKIKGKLVGHGFGLTELGEVAVLFPRLELPAIRLLLSAPLWNVAVSDLATMVGIITVCGSRGLGELLEFTTKRRVNESKKPGDEMRKVLSDALAAGLPSAFRTSTGTMGVPPPSRAAEWARAVIQDDLIEAMCIFEGYRAQVARAVVADPKNFYDATEEWCKKHALSIMKLVEITQAREAAMEEMVVAGVNPFWGDHLRLVKTAPTETLQRIQALKRCIYDAFRLNLITQGGDARRKHYQNRFGLEVSASEPSGKMPAAVTPQFTLVGVKKRASQKADPLRWEIAAPLVSVLETDMAETAVAPNPELLDPKEK